MDVASDSCKRSICPQAAAKILKTTGLKARPIKVTIRAAVSDFISPLHYDAYVYDKYENRILISA
jgi:hypothetical protein